MNSKYDNQVDGEYDRPLPKRITNPTKEDLDKLQEILIRYGAEHKGNPKEPNK